MPSGSDAAARSMMRWLAACLGSTFTCATATTISYSSTSPKRVPPKAGLRLTTSSARPSPEGHCLELSRAMNSQRARQGAERLHAPIAGCRWYSSRALRSRGQRVSDTAASQMPTARRTPRDLIRRTRLASEASCRAGESSLASSSAVVDDGLEMADAGCSGGRSRRHFVDVQAHVLTGRFGAGSSESRPSAVGHFQSYDRLGNRHATDRFQSAAAKG